MRAQRFLFPGDAPRACASSDPPARRSARPSSHAGPPAQALRSATGLRPQHPREEADDINPTETT
eukprot:15142415-Alexandrium_andersonii.AAC.1